MRTAVVTKEFRDRCKELAEQSKIPEVKARLEQLATQYERHLEDLESPPTVPVD